jgi:hypothetical protein
MGISRKELSGYLTDKVSEYDFDEALVKEFYKRNKELFRLGEGLILNETSKLENAGKSYRIHKNVRERFNCWWPIVTVFMKEKPSGELMPITEEMYSKVGAHAFVSEEKLKEYQKVSAFRKCGEVFSEDPDAGGVVVLFKHEKDYYIKSLDGKEMRIWERE